MADPSSLYGRWPPYPTGPEAHMHALGVISVNFNRFEASLFGLFEFPLRKGGVSEAGASALFRRLNNEQRLDVIRFGFQEGEYEGEGEPDPEVRGLVAHLVSYWSACFENRNNLMHSRIRSAETLSEMLLEYDKLLLQKPSKKEWLDVSHFKLGLDELRRIADEMYAGWAFTIELNLFLLERQMEKARPLPEKPPLPARIEALRPLGPIP